MRAHISLNNLCRYSNFFFFNDTATTEIYTLSLHDALPISQATTLVFSNVFRLYLVWRFVGIQPYNRHYARLAVPAAVTAAFMLAVHAALSNGVWSLDLIGTAAVGGFVYFTAFLLVGLTPAEKGALMRVLQRPRTA